MSVRIEKVDLPGIGVRHDLITESGRRLAVVRYRDGERELGLFDAADPDDCRESLRITEEEAAALAELFSASLAVSRITKLTADTDGLYTEKIALPEDSPFAGQTLGDTKTRTRTHVSVVAVIRGRTVIAAPTPDQLLQAGDVVVAVGTRTGLDSATRLLTNGPE